LSLSTQDVPHRLASNAITDHDPAVRARNFVVLQQHYQGSAVAEQAAAAARSSEDAHLLLEVAIMDDDSSLLSRIATEEAFPAQVRVRAIEKLARASWARVAIPVLEQLLGTEDYQVCIAAVEALGKYRYQPALERFTELTHHVDVRMKLTAARALAKIADGASEPTFLDLLKHPDSEVFRTAVRALARIGTTSAVEPLRAAQHFASTPGEKVEVESCIRSIQSRATGAEQGQLSIAAPVSSAGGLSLSEETTEGGVSLAPEVGIDGMESEHPESS